MQYVQLEKFRSQPISEIDIGQVFEGSYAGRANYGFEYEVKVDIKNHDSFFTRLAEGIKHKIICEQKIIIDTVTGTTTFSNILMNAVEEAIISSKE